ncbi:MAG: hypothetical protein KC468_38120 [Myxococcales bacterium]|nr:hypothetical protein [Myxococcales bacterium]
MNSAHVMNAAIRSGRRRAAISVRPARVAYLLAGCLLGCLSAACSRTVARATVIQDPTAALNARATPAAPVATATSTTTSTATTTSSVRANRGAPPGEANVATRPSRPQFRTRPTVSNARFTAPTSYRLSPTEQGFYLSFETDGTYRSYNAFVVEFGASGSYRVTGDAVEFYRDGAVEQILRTTDQFRTLGDYVYSQQLLADYAFVRELGKRLDVLICRVDGKGTWTRRNKTTRGYCDISHDDATVSFRSATVSDRDVYLALTSADDFATLAGGFRYVDEPPEVPAPAPLPPATVGYSSGVDNEPARLIHEATWTLPEERAPSLTCHPDGSASWRDDDSDLEGTCVLTKRDKRVRNWDRRGGYRIERVVGGLEFRSHSITKRFSTTDFAELADLDSWLVLENVVRVKW